MNTYLTPDDPDAFLDYPDIEESLARMDYRPERDQICPVCKGHGGWNRRIHAYPLHDREDTRHNRHLYTHFRCTCNHCVGWGYVSKQERCPGHRWKLEKNLGRCLNRHKCEVCGKTMVVDSSD